MGITNTKHNVKNKWFYDLGGSCVEGMRCDLFDTESFQLIHVSHKLWPPEKFE